MSSIAPFRNFVREITFLADRNLSEPELLSAAHPVMAELLAKDTWLPDACSIPHPKHYRQYLLHCDPYERFSIVSFVWGPGQESPIHDHTVWGLLGVLRGSESSQRYLYAEGALHTTGATEILESGAIDRVSPNIGDIHKVRNPSKSQSVISIHLYGGNIGALNRHIYRPDGTIKNFKSGYALDTIPNIWMG